LKKAGDGCSLLVVIFIHDFLEEVCTEFCYHPLLSFLKRIPVRFVMYLLLTQIWTQGDLDSKHCPELLVAVFKGIRIRIRICRIRMFWASRIRIWIRIKTLKNMES
jgi:hypothetical protein